MGDKKCQKHNLKNICFQEGDMAQRKVLQQQLKRELKESLNPKTKFFLWLKSFINESIDAIFQFQGISSHFCVNLKLLHF